jgi:hypothetical protein
MFALCIFYSELSETRGSLVIIAFQLCREESPRRPGGNENEWNPSASVLMLTYWAKKINVLKRNKDALLGSIKETGLK